jgi:hypothetical protein
MMIIDAITTTTEENVKGEDKNTFWDKNSAWNAIEIYYSYQLVVLTYKFKSTYVKLFPRNAIFVWPCLYRQMNTVMLEKAFQTICVI